MSYVNHCFLYIIIYVQFSSSLNYNNLNLFILSYKVVGDFLFERPEPIILNYYIVILNNLLKVFVPVLSRKYQ